MNFSDFKYVLKSDFNFKSCSEFIFITDLKPRSAKIAQKSRIGLLVIWPKEEEDPAGDHYVKICKEHPYHTIPYNKKKIMYRLRANIL